MYFIKYIIPKNKNHPNKVLILTTPKDLIKAINDNLKFFGLEYTCEKCGKNETIDRFRLDYNSSIFMYNMLLCKKCMHKILSVSHPEWQEKSFQIMKENTGYKSCFQNPKIQKKCRESQLRNNNGKLYIQTEKGREHYRKLHQNNPEKYRYKMYSYFGETFQSSWELAVWIYCKDHNIGIIREPIFFKYNQMDGVMHNYYPDFWIEGIGLVEIKGDQFINKITGEWENKYNKNVDYESKRQCALNNSVILFYKKDIKYYLDYCSYKYNSINWKDIFRSDNPSNPTYANPNGYFPVVKPYTNIPIYYTPLLLSNQVVSYNIKKDNDRYVMNENSRGITPFDVYRQNQ